MSDVVAAPTRDQLQEPPQEGPRLLVPVLAFAGIVTALMQTLVVPVVPELPQLLNASAADTIWAVTATLLAAAVATPIVGRLGDMYGKRRMLLVSIGLLVAGSSLAGLSTALVPLIAGRTLQGLAAGVIPLGISIMRDELPPEKLGSATATMSASLGVGGAIGLPVAAFLAQTTDWHMLFWTSAVLGLLAFVLVMVQVPGDAARAEGAFDLPGAVALSAALIALLLAISKGSAWGWGDALTAGFFAGAAALFVVWGWWELRTPSPLVDLRTTAHRQVLLTNLGSIIFGFSMFAMSLVLPQLLQLPTATGFGLGQSMLTTGFAMAPMGLVMMAMAPLSARITDAFGPKITLMTGAGVVALSYGLGVYLMAEIWQLVLVSAIMGAGVGLSYGAMPALIMGAVPKSETAAANSLNTLMRSIGTSVSSAAAGVVFAQLTITVGGVEMPSQTAFRVVLGIGAAAALVVLGIAAFLPRRARYL